MLICDCLHGDPRRQGGKKMTTKKTPQQIWDQHKAGLPLDTGHTVIEHTHMDPDNSDFVNDGDELWERKGGETDWNVVPQMEG